MATITGSRTVLPDGVGCFVGFAMVKDLVEHARVSLWTQREGEVSGGGFAQGYQRSLLSHHVNRIARGYMNGGAFYGSAILNIRQEDIACGLATVNANNVNLSSGVSLWVIDGQQRIAALRKVYEALDGKEKTKFGKRQIPVQAYYNNDGEQFEGRAFLLHNMAKAVNEDLKERIGQCWPQESREMMWRGEFPGISADLGKSLVGGAQGCDVVDALRLTRSFLRPLIRKPNGLNDTIPLRQHSFIRSLTKSGLFACRLFGNALTGNAVDQANILTTFWTVVREIWPQPFEEAESGKTEREREFSLLSAVCFISMHKLLSDLLRAWEGPFTVERLRPIMASIPGRLDLEWYDRKHSGAKVGSGVEFWYSCNPMILHKGNDGVIRDMHAHLRQCLAGDSSVEAVVKMHTCEHGSRRGGTMDDPQAAVA